LLELVSVGVPEPGVPELGGQLRQRELAPVKAKKILSIGKKKEKWRGEHGSLGGQKEEKRNLSSGQKKRTSIWTSLGGTNWKCGRWGIRWLETPPGPDKKGWDT